MTLFLLLNTKEDVLKNVGDQIFLLWKSMATVNCLITDILQNIFFCVQQKITIPLISGVRHPNFTACACVVSYKSQQALSTHCWGQWLL